MHRMLPEVLDWPFKEGIRGAGVGNYSQKEATQFFNQVGLLILMSCVFQAIFALKIWLINKALAMADLSFFITTNWKQLQIPSSGVLVVGLPQK